ncbi:MAG: hypothetical protein JWQ23_835 [Herminiimonas sp.]|nr:hypothetical protein [Herminiimonas sp.]
MSTDQHSTPQPASRAIAAWRAVYQGYTILNRVTHHALGAFLMLLLVVYFLFCGLFLVLRYAVLPNIDSYKPRIEQMAGKALGRPVSIAAINASWRGLNPHLKLENVVIHDRNGDRALSLPQVSATVSWWSVPVAALRLDSLEIVRPELGIERDKEGNMFVAGLFMDQQQKGDGAALDCVLSQREIVIRDGILRWEDGLRGSPQLVMNGVNMILQNQWRHHRFSLRATPPPEFGAPIDVRADFHHQAFARQISDVAQWTGIVYADWRNADLALWKTYFDYPADIQQGRGAVRAWLSFDHAKVADLTADLNLSDLSARLRQDLAPLTLAQFDGRVTVREALAPGAGADRRSFGAHGYTVALSDFSLETNDGLKLPVTSISHRFTPASEMAPERNEFSASALDLRTTSDFLAHLPLSASQRKMLDDYAPRGQLKNFTAKWQGIYPDLASYQVKGEFIGLSIKPQAPRPALSKSTTSPASAAVQGIPGFDNLTGSINASDQGGTVHVESSDLVLHVPGYFADPALPFEQLNMQAKWALKDKGRVRFQVDSLQFVQDGMTGSLSGKHVMPAGAVRDKGRERNAEGGPGTLDLNARINQFDIVKVARYLPLQTPEGLRNWLTGALVGGRARDVAIDISGDLAHFPFRTERPGDKPRGRFSVTAKIENGVLNYLPGHFGRDQTSPMWPMLEAINGSFMLDRTRLHIRADSASTHGVALSKVDAAIADLSHAERILNITGSAGGPLQNFLRYTVDSPVGDWIGRFTDETRGSGNAKLGLKLDLPLAHPHDAKVQGTLQFAGNDVTLQNLIPPLMQASGDLKFHEKGFELNAIRANFLGGPVAVSGGTQSEGGIAIKADGTVSSDGLRKTYPSPVMQRLFQQITGATRYGALISVKDKRPEIVIESGLQGISLDFPAPLRKAANESLPLRFELAGVRSEDASVLRDEITMSLGTAIAARYSRKKSNGANDPWLVERGGIGVNVPAPEPDSGLIANVNLKSLDIDAWRNSVASILAGNTPAPAVQVPAETAAPAASDALNIAQYIDPEVLAARATELVVMGKTLNNVVVGASHQKNIWQANIDSEQASGYVTWSESQTGRGLGRVTARLASLIIPRSAASDVSDLLDAKNSTMQMPGLDIVAENFELMGKKLGHIELLANNAAGPNGREWRISKLTIANPDGTLNASGKWGNPDKQSTTTLNYVLDIADAGKLLDRFGFANVLRGGQGKMDGEITWKGLPFSIDIPSLSGQVNLNLAAGQFLKVDPGAAKLLSVLSLQSLPRRLALDFRDLFSEGFAFDGVIATANIANGLMTTENFKMRSVSAAVLMNGSVDISRESQNLHVAVLPEINVGAASVVYGLLVNPVIGLGSFLAQLFLRDPLMQAFTMEYRISGPWKDPVVTKLERRNANAPTAPGSPGPGG